MVTAVPLPSTPPSLSTTAITRRARLRAGARDLLALLPPLATASMIAVAWILVRTAWGRDDARDLDTAIALAIVAAVPPAWLARIALALLTAQATPGQRAERLAVDATRARIRHAVAVRLALHPLGAIGWGWVAGELALAQWYTAALAAGALAAVLLLCGLVSLAIILVAPDARALHDRAAGTRLVRA